jgi:hypothetical protein
MPISQSTMFAVAQLLSSCVFQNPHLPSSVLVPLSKHACMVLASHLVTAAAATAVAVVVGRRNRDVVAAAQETLAAHALVAALAGSGAASSRRSRALVSHLELKQAETC